MTSQNTLTSIHKILVVPKCVHRYYSFKEILAYLSAYVHVKGGIRNSGFDQI